MSFMPRRLLSTRYGETNFDRPPRCRGEPDRDLGCAFGLVRFELVDRIAFPLPQPDGVPQAAGATRCFAENGAHGVRTSTTAIAAMMLKLGEADAMLCGTFGQFQRHLMLVRR